jgi:hypothetical protein
MSPVACPNCEREVPELDSECPSCGPAGRRGSSVPSPDGTEPRGYYSDAVAALSLAVGALLIWPLALLAVVYGLAARRTFREEKDRHQAVEKGGWMATVAIAWSVVVIPLVIYGVVFV